MRDRVEPAALALMAAALITGCAGPRAEPLVSPPASRGGEIVLRVATAQDADPFAAGRAAAQGLREQMGSTPPHAILLAECFDDQRLKKQALKGVCSVFPREIVFGGATYGVFSHAGCLDRHAVGLLGIGGPGIAAAAALEERLGTAKLSGEKAQAEIAARLRAAGERLVRRLPRRPDDRLLILLADAHSPKNQSLVEGAQIALGKDFPMTGGSANKNAGQTFVYFRGRMLADSAIALLLSGDFQVSLAGRQAKDNATVISTARDAAAEALTNLKARPVAAIAFDCAGRKGKLDRIEDELAALRQSLGSDIPLFGCYCAGEIGPADAAERRPGVLSSGVGWHVMVTLLGRP